MLKPNPEFVEELKKTVAASPYPTTMAMRLSDIDFDYAEVELDTDRRHLQPYGIVHGGVIATLIDTATFWAGFMRIPEDSGLVNIDLKLNYLQPVVNKKLRAEGRAVRSGKTLIYTEAKVVDEDGALIACGSSSLMVLPGKGLNSRAPKFLDENAA